MWPSCLRNLTSMFNVQFLYYRPTVLNFLQVSNTNTSYKYSVSSTIRTIFIYIRQRKNPYMDPVRTASYLCRSHSGDALLPAAAAAAAQTLHVIPARDLWVLRGDPDVPLPLLLLQDRVCGWSLHASVCLCFHGHFQVRMRSCVTLFRWNLPGFCLTFSSFCVCQHKPAAQRYDYRPDSPDSPLSRSGFGSAVFWLFHLQDVMVGRTN